MKKLAVVILALAALAGCGGGPSGQAELLSGSESLKREEPAAKPSEENRVDDGFIREAVLNFGAEERENEDGEKVLRPMPVSLFYCDRLDRETLTTKEIFSWYLGYALREELTEEERFEKYQNPIGEEMGWFFPAEYYEPAVMSYFDVTQEFLHDDYYYNREYDGYTVDGGGGVGHRPEITVKGWEQEGALIQISLDFPEMHRQHTGMILTVRLMDGGHQFVSYLPQDEA